MIILNSSIQYFPDLNTLIDRLLSLLKPNGEIHIMDSPLYKSVSEYRKAKGRSEAYYSMLGFIEMGEHYFHHTINDLDKYNYKLLFNPSCVLNLLRKRLGMNAGVSMDYNKIKDQSR